MEFLPSYTLEQINHTCSSSGYKWSSSHIVPYINEAEIEEISSQSRLYDPFPVKNGSTFSHTTVIDGVSREGSQKEEIPRD